MESIRPIFWGHGQFLTPQHLQQQDLFHHTQRHLLAQSVQPHGWGLARLEIRTEGFEDRLFEVTVCEAFARDGVHLRAGSQADRPNAALPVRSFEKAFDPSKGRLGVYLGLPRHLTGQNNLGGSGPAAGDEQAPRRYRLAAEQTPDGFDIEAPDGELSFLEYALEVVFDTDPGFSGAEKTFELIKLAEIVATSGGKGFQLATDFIPACLSIGASPVLLTLVKNVRDGLTGRAREFAELKRSRGARATASGFQDVLRLVILQTLNRYVPYLHHVTEQVSLHPEPTYALMRQIVGDLSGFSEVYDVFGASAEGQTEKRLPTYDHENLTLCFAMVTKRIRDLLEALTAGPEFGIVLTYQEEYFRAELPPTFFEGRMNRYYLMIDSTMQGQELWALLQRVGKVSSLEQMPRLRQSALFGLKIEFLPVPPEELPQRSSRYSYFQIDTNSPHWKLIETQRNISMYCDLDAEDTTIRILKVASEV